MSKALKVVGRLEQIAKEMAAAGYMEVNPDTAHWLRMSKAANGGMTPMDQAVSELMRKRELEAGIMTWVKFECMEAMYLEQGNAVCAEQLAMMRQMVSSAKAGGAGTGNGVVAVPGTIPPPTAAPAVSPTDSAEHRTTDLTPKPPLDWKNDIKRFDPFKGFKSEHAEVNGDGDLIYKPANAPSQADSAGPLGKTFQPPTANGKSSWPKGLW